MIYFERFLEGKTKSFVQTKHNIVLLLSQYTQASSYFIHNLKCIIGNTLISSNMSYIKKNLSKCS